MRPEHRTSSRHGSRRISPAELKAREDALKKLGGKGAGVVFGFFECKIGADQLNDRGEVLIVPLNSPGRNAKTAPGKTTLRGQYVNPAHLRSARPK